MGEFKKKNVGWGEGAPMPPSHTQSGKPNMYIILLEYACELFFYKLRIEI